ncbi:MAG: hypothetical protein A3J93_00345 [Candidatus Magasanikbacteria bacterium RIFOXYC2_FULL_42_28]|uniref:Transcription elongation factor GreA n=1 Tax=Candidatus Magasanikbacteria bacterium RIFOXYC2_FULL_42_28 TaxID=1798704 RepID=A0A1F6NWE1_9BACT|nr:MAG: hypothetical protein A3J93_00345 [Candidatus Magasanikbacteria bacterium RIFOXYC2_FULL_42_28]
MIDDQPIHYLTPASLENLKKEKEEVENIKIPEIAKRIDEAKQQGDLSENAEYHAAREEMSWAQGRLAEIDRILQNSQIFNKSANKDEVQLGCTVVVKVNGKEKEFTIVGPQEVNPAKGYISNESPLGEALLGHAKGDKVTITTPAGKQVYEIVKIK